MRIAAQNVLLVPLELCLVTPENKKEYKVGLGPNYNPSLSLSLSTYASRFVYENIEKFHRPLIESGEHHRLTIAKPL